MVLRPGFAGQASPFLMLREWGGAAAPPGCSPSDARLETRSSSTRSGEAGREEGNCRARWLLAWSAEGPPPEHAAVGRSHPGPLPMSSGGYRSPSLVGRAAFDAMGCVTAPASLASLLAAPVTGLLLEMASLTSLSAGPRPWRPRGCLAARTLTRSSLPDSLSIY